MISAKKLGFKKGDFVHTGLFPGIIIGDAHTSTPLCEVWGIEHECGGVYAHDLRHLTYVEFLKMTGKSLPILLREVQTEEARKALLGNLKTEA